MSDISRKIIIDADSSGISKNVQIAADASSSSFERMGDRMRETLEKGLDINEKISSIGDDNLDKLRHELRLREQLNNLFSNTAEIQNQPPTDEGIGVAQMPPISPPVVPPTTPPTGGGAPPSSPPPRQSSFAEPFRRGGNFVGNIGRSAVYGFGGALGFGALFSIGGALAKLVSEGKQLDDSAGQLGGIMESKSEALSTVPSQFMGLKQSDLMSYAKNVAQTLGTTDDLKENFRNQLAFERGFGLEVGKLNQGNQVLRAEKGDRTTADTALEMLNIFRASDLFNVGKDDFSLLAEKIDFQSQLNQQQATQMESINSTISTRLIESFGRLEGSFSDFRQVSTLNTINQSITNPQSDFQKAFVFRALRRENPDMSLFDLMKQQEKGIYGEGNLSAILEDLFSTFSGEMLKFNVSKIFGLNLSQASSLTENYQNNEVFRENLDNISNTKDLSISIDDLDKNSQDITRKPEEVKTFTEINKDTQNITDIVNKKEFTDIKEVNKDIQNINDIVNKKEFVKEINKDTQNITDVVKEKEFVTTTTNIKDEVDETGKGVQQRKDLFFDQQDIIQRGYQNVGSVNRIMSEFDTKAGALGIDAIKKFDRDYADKILEGDVIGVMGQVLKDIGTTIKSGFEGFFSDFSGNMDRLTDSIFGKYKESIEQIGQSIGESIANLIYGKDTDGKKVIEERINFKERLVEVFPEDKDIEEIDPQGNDYNENLREFVFDNLYRQNVSSTFDMAKQDVNKDNLISEREMTPKQRLEFDKLRSLKESKIDQLLERVVELLEKDKKMTPTSAFNKVYQNLK